MGIFTPFKGSFFILPNKTAKNKALKIENQKITKNCLAEDIKPKERRTRISSIPKDFLKTRVNRKITERIPTVRRTERRFRLKKTNIKILAAMSMCTRVLGISLYKKS